MCNQRTFKNRITSVFAGIAIALLTIHPVLADDSEIFFANTASISPNSNVVFMLDTSGSMDRKPKNASDNKKKIEIVKDVFWKILFDSESRPNTIPDPLPAVNPSNKGLNFAVMRFNPNRGSNDHGGRFITELQELNENTKDAIWDAVAKLDADGSTPLAETAYEASLYFDGLSTLWGKNSVVGVQTDIVYDDNNSNTIVSSKYVSPFDNVSDQTQCAINNHLVILTDGQPRNDGAADDYINAWFPPNAVQCTFEQNTTNSCLPKVAKYLYNKDFLPNIAETQNVRTHTIAFDLDVGYAVNILKRTALHGGGERIVENEGTDQETETITQFYEASDDAELSNAISKIIYQVNRSAKTFVTPAVSVSSANKFAHDNTLYFALFEPEVSPQWGGNMKGYYVDADGVLKDFSDPRIAAQDSRGQFVDSARSKWSTSNDGNNILQGGAASRFTLAQTRSIYTQNASNEIVSLNNQSISNSDVGAADNGEKEAIVNWAMGKTADGQSLREKIIGDPLHSQPVVVNYGGSVGPVIFFGTNQGFVHAIDAETGVEKFAFIPRALLGNLKTYKDDIIPPNGETRPYGMDGPISIIVKDRNDNHVVDTDTDQVILVAGMRRGGNNYYALDITDLNNPDVLWQINGGTGDFPALAQSWSKPVFTKIEQYVSGTTDGELVTSTKDVVLFTGGYDPGYDPQLSDDPDVNNVAPIPASPSGNAIYAVDLANGNLVWKATGTTGSAGDPTADSLQVTGMNNAIPADVSAIDTNSDGIMDRLYTIDITGKLFRIDFVNDDANTAEARYTPIGRLFADLSGGNRRFFNPIDVSYSKMGLKPMIHLSVGSGLRPHPLFATSNDRFYSIWDSHVFENLPTGNNFTAITQNNLQSTTSQIDASDMTSGWYFDLTAGEKALSKSTTLGGYVFFTTYFPPEDSGTPSCTAKLGTGSLYVVKLHDSSGLIPDTRNIAINSVGIPSSPMFLTLAQPETDNTNPDNPFVNQETKTYIMVGTEIINEGTGGANNDASDLQDLLNTLYPILDNPNAKFYWTQQ